MSHKKHNNLILCQELGFQRVREMCLSAGKQDLRNNSWNEVILLCEVIR